MAELPLSKFAPFDKYECRYQERVSNKHVEIGVHCNNCIYRQEEVPKEKVAFYSYMEPYQLEGRFFYCSILTERDNIISENALCRFFTSNEEIELKSEEEELSIQIQKLDFSNSDISESINNLREKLINDTK